MYGTLWSRSIRALGQMVLHPRHATLWLRDRLTGRQPLKLELPWLSWPCIDFLEKLELRGRRVFEYGSGGSTPYFLKRGCRVRAVENDPNWVSRVGAAAAAYREGLDLRVVEMPEHPGVNDALLAQSYVSVLSDSAPWDLTLVDGVDGKPSVRMKCLELARQCVSADGIVLLDDSWRDEYSAAPLYMTGLAQTLFQGLGPARLGVTRTDAYSRK